MKRLIALYLLLALPLFAYSQQRINRNVAGLTLGRLYSVARAQSIIEDKFECFSRVYRESSSTTIMTVSSIPFAGEKWDCLSVTQESLGRISEILFGKNFKDRDELLSFCTRVAGMLVTKYGPPSSHSEKDLALEWVWSDSRNTNLHLQAIFKKDSEEPDITVFLSYTDEVLMKKIQSDTMDEL